MMLARLTERKEWKFFGVLPKADPGLAVAWWTALLLRGTLPAAFAITMGVLVGAVQRGSSLAAPLAVAGTIFVLLQVLNPIHQAVSANLGDRTAAWLYDRLTEACVRPPGMGHLEDPALTSDLTVARDFDLGMTGPPLAISMDFIAGGMVEMIGGVASALILARYAWWAPVLLAGAWLATHWLLRESAIWWDRNTEEVRRRQPAWPRRQHGSSTCCRRAARRAAGGGGDPAGRAGRGRDRPVRCRGQRRRHDRGPAHRGAAGRGKQARPAVRVGRRRARRVRLLRPRPVGLRPGRHQHAPGGRRPGQGRPGRPGQPAAARRLALLSH